MTDTEKLFDEIHELEAKYFLTSYTQNSFNIMREKVIEKLSGRLDALVIPPVEITPIKWIVLEEFYPKYGIVAGGIKIEQRKQRDNCIKYAITMRENMEYNHKESDFDMIPLPSERTDEYLIEHRYDTFAAAVKDAFNLAQKTRDEWAV